MNNLSGVNILFAKILFEFPSATFTFFSRTLNLKSIKNFHLFEIDIKCFKLQPKQI